MYENYSVLMSVYYKEKPEYLRKSMQSIWDQTIPTNNFVLVCDGPLGENLNCVIEEMKERYGSRLYVRRLKENSGLGNALNAGLQDCVNELVARMDSDDISRPNRCEKQIELFNNDPELALSSGAISEFVSDVQSPTGSRYLPIDHKSIIVFSRKRNPFNHPCVMFKRSAVIDAGGYKETFHLFEDYYLWVRMLMKGYKAQNTREILLDMRTPSDMYLRRGGKKYAEDMLRFHRWMKKAGWSSNIDYVSGALPHAVVCVLPNSIRKVVYSGIHKSK